MSDKVVPTVKEQAPEESVLALRQESDEQFMARVLGTKPSDVAESEKPAGQEEPKEQPADGKPVEEAVADGEPGEKEVEPEGEAEPKEEPKKEESKAYDFKVFDKEGELEVPEDLTFTFTANGKVRENVPLPNILKLAQMGYYNHEREQEVKQKESAAEAAVQERDQLQATLADALTRIRRMLTEPDYYDSFRDAFNEYNTPDQRAARAEQEAQRAREMLAQQQEVMTVAQAIQSHFIPAAESLLRENPLVSDTELHGRFSILVAPLLVNGRLPAERIPYVMNLLQNDLATWVRAVNVERAEGEAKKAKSVERARTDAALLKRQVARVVKPAGGPGPEKSNQPEPKSAKDWFEQRFATPA